jgi:hypothetical protein
MPRIERRAGVLFLNPGSAGPRRFKLPVAVARLRVRGEKTTARIVEISETPPRTRSRAPALPAVVTSQRRSTRSAVFWAWFVALRIMSIACVRSLRR